MSLDAKIQAFQRKHFNLEAAVFSMLMTLYSLKTPPIDVEDFGLGDRTVMVRNSLEHYFSFAQGKGERGYS